METKEWLIPAFEKTTEPDREIKNILILALSTFRTSQKKDGGITPGTMSCDIAGMYVPDEEYYYQLEPVPMMLTHTLARAGEQIDEVIMICTDACTKRNAGYYLDAPEGRIYLKGASGDEGVSPRDYFAEFLKKYMREHGSCDEPYFFEVDYPKENTENAQNTAIRQIIAEVRRHSEANIYIDTHGGPRSHQEVINEALSLLRAEGIRISSDHIFAVRDADNPLKIVKAGSSLAMLDFISGMTELMNYGRVDTLNQFLESVQISGEDRELIDTVGNIACQMQLCMIPEYEKNLDKLTLLLESREQTPAGGNPLLDTFINNIRNNYKGLLTPERTVIDEIRWSLEKGFYQQVLTLIEGRMAGYLHEQNLFRYGEEIAEQETQQNYELNNDIFNNTVNKLIKHKDRLKIFDGIRIDLHEKTAEYEGLKVFVEVHGETAKEFLRLHCGMKEVRNSANHASRDQSILMHRGAFKQSVKRYLEMVERMKNQADDEYMIVWGIKADIVVCSADKAEKWNWKMKKDIENLGTKENLDTVERVGGNPVSAQSSDDDIREAAVKTVRKISRLYPSAAILDVWEEDEPEYAHKKQYWNAVEEELKTKGIKVLRVRYRFLENPDAPGGKTRKYMYIS